MKRWIIAISILMLIGIMGAALRQWMATAAPSDDPMVEPGTTDAMGDGATDMPQSSITESTPIPEPAPDEDVDSAAGQLLMIDHRLYPDHKLVLFDLATDEERTLFNVPQDGWLYQLDASPDGSQVALSYAAPPANDAVETADRSPYDRSGIYLLSLEEPTATPVLLFGNREANEHLFNPIWSPDGQSIYYIRYRRLMGVVDTLDVALYRYDLTSEGSKFIVQDGAWPRMSPNGEWLVYIQVDPLTTARSIHIANPDGEQARELIPASQFFDVDTPHFSADNQWIYFSAVSHSTKISDQDSSQSYNSWKAWEWLLGVKVAQAHTDHNVPADWWRISVDGGEPEQITSVRRIISYGMFDDRGERLFFTANTGVYSVNAEGDELDRVSLPNLYRFFAWMP